MMITHPSNAGLVGGCQEVGMRKDADDVYHQMTYYQIIDTGLSARCLIIKGLDNQAEEYLSKAC
jgi:hypothetical protein